jgi:hypothetical protein
MRLPGLFFTFFELSTRFSRWLWKNLWIAGLAIASTDSDRRFAISGSTRGQESNRVKNSELGGEVPI